jgi:hypothetical protein
MVDKLKQRPTLPSIANSTSTYIPLPRQRWAGINEWIFPSTKMKRRVFPAFLGISYVAILFFLGDLRSDHIWLGLLGLLDFYNEKSRDFLKLFLPFILTGVIYDSMRYFYWQGIDGNVHVLEPYLRDLNWFGIRGQTPNEFCQVNANVILDLLCGFAYLTFVAEYLLVAFFLFFSGNYYLLQIFGWSFFVDNVFGFITYFIYPAAPPWYVNHFGFGPAHMGILPNSAQAYRFDEILGTHFFDQVYGRGVDVYGAYPSLHVSYPFLVIWVTFQVPALGWARIPALLFYGLMCFSAVYLQHHYVVDLLLGTFYASMTIGIISLFCHWKNRRKVVLT